MKRSRLLPALGLFAGALFWGCFSDKSVDPTSTDTVEELQLKGSISGTVTDSVNHGISGVAVTLDSGGFSTNTDSLGRYTIPDVPGRTWTVRFTKTNWADTSVPGVVLAIDEDRKGVDMRMRAALDSTFTNLVDTTGSFAGTVKDTAGKPLSNVSVLLVGGKGQSTVTDSVGGFVLSDVPAGSWGISFGRSGYADTAIAGLTIARKEKKTGIVATMRPVPVQIIDTTGSFAGVVMDTALKPLSGVTVMVVGQTGLTTLSDSVGNFAIKKIPAGTWGVRFAKFGYDDTILEQEPLAAKENRASIVAKLRPLTLDSGRFLSGTLSDLAGFKTLEVSALSRTTGKAIPVTSLLWTASGNWTAVLGTSHDSGTLSLVARDSAGHATGYLSHSFAAATGPLPVPAFPVRNAVPKVEAGSNATVSVGRTHLLKAQATDSLTNAGIASVEWSCGTSTTWVPEGASGYSLSLPKDTGALVCRVRATDKDSNVVKGSLVLKVVNTRTTINGFDNVSTYARTVNLALNAIDVDGVAKVHWNFGDGTADSTCTGASSAIQHTYVGPIPATYVFRVTATVVDSFGDTTSLQKMVSIFNEAAVISSSFDTATITPNDTVTYTATISDKNGVAKVLWNFGDGTIDTTYTSGTVTKKHTYPGIAVVTPGTAGKYALSIEVLDSLGGKTSTSQIGLKKDTNDIPTVVVNDTVGEVGTNLTLHTVAKDLGRITQYEWSLDGTIFKIGTKDTTIVLPATPNVNYPVYVRVKDEDGNVSKVDTIRIIVGEYITHSRDGQRYRITTIGSQTWMAQNLNYQVDSSWWYMNSADSGAKYGRLYTWASAMGLDDTCNTKSCATLVQAKHQGVCPSGWHVPADADWNGLATFIKVAKSLDAPEVANFLRAEGQAIGWTYNFPKGGDPYGFTALPSGMAANGKVVNVLEDASMWSSTEKSEKVASYRYFGTFYFSPLDNSSTSNNKSGGYSLRCLKD